MYNHLSHDARAREAEIRRLWNRSDRLRPLELQPGRRSRGLRRRTR